MEEQIRRYNEDRRIEKMIKHNRTERRERDREERKRKKQVTKRKTGNDAA